LLSSGLMLATTENIKVRNQKVGYETSDNGVLTAYEAMSLNLEGTQLVILSACETGLGEIRAGEGVYGLQRAFLVAGAQALIMSLWKVDDIATQELMTNFYSAIEKSSDIFQAFRSAQRKLMVKYPDPYFGEGLSLYPIKIIVADENKVIDQFTGPSADCRS
jgi:CHAT domain-containing protein